MLYLLASEQRLHSYLRAVEQYSLRTLTHPEDRTNAFTGVLQRYQYGDSGAGFYFLHGLPTLAFDETACWQAAEHSPQARNATFLAGLGWAGIMV
jgi:hypothetical protein